jgi:hypothetical protein
MRIRAPAIAGNPPRNRLLKNRFHAGSSRNSLRSAYLAHTL